MEDGPGNSTDYIFEMTLIQSTHPVVKRYNFVLRNISYSIKPLPSTINKTFFDLKKSFMYMVAILKTFVGINLYGKFDYAIVNMQHDLHFNFFLFLQWQSKRQIGYTEWATVNMWSPMLGNMYLIIPLLLPEIVLYIFGDKKLFIVY